MALHYRTCGFVIKKSDAGESDRVFTVFSKDFGKVRILGKAIRKISSKLRSGIDAINFSEIEFIQGKAQKTLTDIEPLDCFRNIKCDLPRLKVAHRIADMVNSLVSGEQADSVIYDLLNISYSKLNEENLSSLQVQLVYFGFIWNLFSILGYKPEVYNCVVCQNRLDEDSIFFSPDGAGLVCSRCLGSVGMYKKINTDVVKILRLIIKKDFNTLLKLSIPLASGKILRTISNQYYYYLLSVHLSCDDFNEKRMLI